MNIKEEKLPLFTFIDMLLVKYNYYMFKLYMYVGKTQSVDLFFNTGKFCSGQR